MQDEQGHLLPNSVGIGLKSVHYQEILSSRPSLDFLEVHAENYMMEDGPHHRYLTEITKEYALSIHGVGMSLGSVEGLSKDHLKKFRTVVDRYKPALVSEHIAWSVQGGHFLNDLLPLPFNAESVACVARNISELQDYIGRQILVENPSSYMAFKQTDMPEFEFLNRLVDQTSCGLLLDLNNIFVSCENMKEILPADELSRMGWDAHQYITQINGAAIGELHLAGHELKDVDGVKLRIDDHGSAVIDDVWDLYAAFLDAAGPKPALIEWDNNIPDLSVLISEVEKARHVFAAKEGSYV